MNSDDIIKRLNVMLNDKKLSAEQKAILDETVRHIKLQDDEMLDLREDITDWGD